VSDRVTSGRLKVFIGSDLKVFLPEVKFTVSVVNRSY